MALLVSIIDGKGTVTADNIAITGGMDTRDFSGITNNFLDGGVVRMDTTTLGMDVTQNSPAGMNVVIGTGIAYVRNSNFTETGSTPKLYEVKNTAAVTASIAANASGSTRYDLIALDVDTAGTPDDTASNIATYTVVQGTGGAGIPALGSDQELLAIVTVPNGASSITDANIEDLRREQSPKNVPGWTSVNDTWVYDSASDPSYVAQITGVDRTDFYYAGMKVKIYQRTGGTKYFIITKVALNGSDTEITLFGGTDYDLSNEAIYIPQVSTVKAPKGFPLSRELWKVEASDGTSISQSSPVQNTWYSVLNISVPVGRWYGEMVFQMDFSDTNGTTFAHVVTLGTTDAAAGLASATIAENLTVPGVSSMRAVTNKTVPLVGSDFELTTADIFYMNQRTTVSGVNSIAIRGDNYTTRVTLYSSYL